VCTLPTSVELQKRCRHPRDWVDGRWATMDLGGDARAGWQTVQGEQHELLAAAGRERG
jgi:hypothetical protein